MRFLWILLLPLSAFGGQDTLFIQPADGDYTNITDAVGANLTIDAGDTMFFYFDGWEGGGARDTVAGSWDIDGWVINGLMIWEASPSNAFTGVYYDSLYTIVLDSAATTNIQWQIGPIQSKGISWRYEGDHGGVMFLRLEDGYLDQAAESLLFDACYFYTSNRAVFYQTVTASVPDIKIRNCLFDGAKVASEAIWLGVTGTNNWYIHNCTFVHFQRVFESYSPTINSENCLVFSNEITTELWYPSGGTFTANYLSTDIDTTLTGTGHRKAQDFTFVDSSNGNWLLHADDAGAIDYGIDLSADGDLPVILDVQGYSRNGLTYDIGFHEQEATAGADTVDVCPSGCTAKNVDSLLENYADSNRVTAAAKLVVHITGDWSEESGYAVNVNGGMWTPNATYNVKIVATGAARAAMPWSSTAYSPGKGVDGKPFTISGTGLSRYIEIEGLQIDCNYTGSSSLHGGIIMNDDARGARIHDNVIRNAGSNTNYQEGINTYNLSTDRADSNDVWVYNNYIYDFDNNEFSCGIYANANGGGSAGDATGFIFNNTIVNCYRGIEGGGHYDSEIRNNLLYKLEGAASDGNTLDSVSGWNTCDSATNWSCFEGCDYDSSSVTITFVDYGSDDFRLASAAIATNGFDLSAYFTTDQAGTTRSTWTRGAHYYTAAVAANYRRRRMQTQ